MKKRLIIPKYLCKMITLILCLIMASQTFAVAELDLSIIQKSEDEPTKETGGLLPNIAPIVPPSSSEEIENNSTADTDEELPPYIPPEDLFDNLDTEALKVRTNDAPMQLQSVLQQEETVRILAHISLENLSNYTVIEHMKYDIYVIEVLKSEIPRKSSHQGQLMTFSATAEEDEFEFIEYDYEFESCADEVPWGVDYVSKQQSTAGNGAGMKVALLDTGVDISNADILLSGGISFVDGVNSYTDDNGHGTAMAGIISAKSNDSGLVGIAPEAELYSVKVLDSTKKGFYSNVVKGIYWAIENDINIVVMPFGGRENSRFLHNAYFPQSSSTSNNLHAFIPNTLAILKRTFTEGQYGKLGASNCPIYTSLMSAAFANSSCVIPAFLL